jgi:ketosteroid isomerase-like protein
MAPEDRSGDIELTKERLEAFNRGDLERVLSGFDRDIEVYAPPEVANAAHFRGRDEYLPWLGRWLEAWDGFTIDVRRIEPVGSRHVVVLAHQSARGKGSGIPVEMEMAHMFELRGGLTAAHHLYPSWEQAVEAAERRERESAE